MNNDLLDKNLFMMCSQLNKSALTSLSEEYHIRNCKENELGIWKSMPSDDERTAKNGYSYMTQYFNNVYGKNKGLFFEKCIFVCNKEDKPIGTCFAWKSYGKINTIHWFKVIKEYENKGIGRALLSIIMEKETDYPIYLHTQLGSYRAIKLYTDFGFKLLSDTEIGNRNNDIDECLPLLKELMGNENYNTINITKANKEFLKIVKGKETNEF